MCTEVRVLCVRVSCVSVCVLERRELIWCMSVAKEKEDTFFSSRMTVSCTPLGLKQWVGSG